MKSCLPMLVLTSSTKRSHENTSVNAGVFSCPKRPDRTMIRYIAQSKSNNLEYMQNRRHDAPSHLPEEPKEIEKSIEKESTKEVDLEEIRKKYGHIGNALQNFDAAWSVTVGSETDEDKKEILAEENDAEKKIQAAYELADSLFSEESAREHVRGMIRDYVWIRFKLKDFHNMSVEKLHGMAAFTSLHFSENLDKIFLFTEHTRSHNKKPSYKEILGLVDLAKPFMLPDSGIGEIQDDDDNDFAVNTNLAVLEFTNDGIGIIEPSGCAKFRFGDNFIETLTEFVDSIKDEYLAQRKES
jgi:hypothetical protein